MQRDGHRQHDQRQLGRRPAAAASSAVRDGNAISDSSTISGNSAGYGGGICGRVNVTVTDSTISDNSAGGNAAAAS